MIVGCESICSLAQISKSRRSARRIFYSGTHETLNESNLRDRFRKSLRFSHAGQEKQADLALQRNFIRSLIISGRSALNSPLQDSRIRTESMDGPGGETARIITREIGRRVGFDAGRPGKGLKKPRGESKNRRAAFPILFAPRTGARARIGAGGVGSAFRLSNAVKKIFLK